VNDEQLLRYGRQILLPEIDLDGQQKIRAATVLLVGLGGLGSAIAYYLAGAGVGRLILNDFDTVDKSNLQRQIVHQESSVGINKAISAQQTLQKLNSDISIEAISEKLDHQALLELAAGCDAIVDGSDNFATRHLMNEISLRSAKPLVSGAAIRLEGQVSVFNAKADSPCYACLYGSDNSDDNMTCSENGVLAPLVGIIGSIQALETLKLIAGFGETLDKRLLLLDGKTMNVRSMKLAQDPGCICHQWRKESGER
jgi:molybdopterin-synthase adenylyltransferase